MTKRFKHTALVLEGSGMRGVFTSGILDWMIDHNVTFPYLVGVSAGSSNALSFASHQCGRAKYTFADLQANHHYLGVRNLLCNHNTMDMGLLYHELPETLCPTTMRLPHQPHAYRERSHRLPHE